MSDFTGLASYYYLDAILAQHEAEARKADRLRRSRVSANAERAREAEAREDARQALPRIRRAIQDAP